ncbi:MAG: hypothetical protein GY778_10290 [bacterium]|nr:hypothetical protein [bacterium]
MLKERAAADTNKLKLGLGRYRWTASIGLIALAAAVLWMRPWSSEPEGVAAPPAVPGAQVSADDDAPKVDPPPSPSRTRPVERPEPRKSPKDVGDTLPDRDQPTKGGSRRGGDRKPERKDPPKYMNEDLS